MTFKKIIFTGILTIIVSAQCSGAADISQHEKNKMFLNAVKFGDSKKITELLNSKASIAALDENYNNALIMTVRCYDPHSLKTLLSHASACAIINQGGGLSNGTALHEAADKNHVDMIRTLLESKANINQVDTRGWTALHVASHEGKNKAVRTLLAHGASIEVIDNKGKLALHTAAHRLYYKTICILLDAHYNLLMKQYPTIRSEKIDDTGNQMTILPPHDTLEIIAGQLAPCDLASFRLVCKNFHASAWKAFENIRKLRAPQLKAILMQRLQDVLDMIQATWEAEYDRKTIIELLKTELQKTNKLDVHTILHGDFICNEKLHSCVVQNEKNEMLLDATKARDAKKVQELLANKASVTALDDIRNTTLFWAIKYNDIETLQVLLGNENVSAIINPGNIFFHQTALHDAAKEGHVNIILALLAAGACIDNINTHDETALYIAVRWSRNNAARTLLTHGASINKTNKEGQTALHKAACDFNFEATNMILDAHFNALMKRCPAIGSIKMRGAGNQMTILPPHDALEIIAGQLAPCDLASFRLVCKDFHSSASQIFEKIRTLRAPQLKNMLIQLINDVLDKTEVKKAVIEKKENKTTTIQLLKVALQKAEELAIARLLQGEIICNGEPRPCISPVDLDL